MVFQGVSGCLVRLTDSTLEFPIIKKDESCCPCQRRGLHRATLSTTRTKKTLPRGRGEVKVRMVFQGVSRCPARLSDSASCNSLHESNEENFTWGSGGGLGLEPFVLNRYSRIPGTQQQEYE